MNTKKPLYTKEKSLTFQVILWWHFWDICSSTIFNIKQ